MGSMTKTYKPKNKNIVKLKKYINGFRKDIRNNVRVTAENGDFLIAENGDNIIIEE
jgi:hypothetical protein